MGMIRLPIGIRATPKRKSLRPEAMVDTGASYTVVPRDLAKRAGLRSSFTRPVHLADGRIGQFGVATALVKVDGREAPVTVFISPRGEVLLGAESLEILGITVDPRRRRLKMGRWYGLSAASVLSGHP